MCPEIFIEYLLIAVVAEDAGSTFRRNSAQFADYRMVTTVCVIDCMVVPACAVVVFPAASEMAANHTQPEISFQITLTAVCQRLFSDRG